VAVVALDWASEKFEKYSKALSISQFTVDYISLIFQCLKNLITFPIPVVSGSDSDSEKAAFGLRV
jgi:hypothetical protein